MCLCQHGTEGRNCESCLPDHWDRPWRRATTENAWECRGNILKKGKRILINLSTQNFEKLFNSFIV